MSSEHTNELENDTDNMDVILVFQNRGKTMFVNCEEMKLRISLGLNVKMKTDESKLLPVATVKWEDSCLKLEKC